MDSNSNSDQQQDIYSRNTIEQVILAARKSLKEEKYKLEIPDSERSKLECLIEESTKWINENPNANSSQFKERYQVIESIYHPIIQRIERVEIRSDSYYLKQEQQQKKRRRPGGAEGGFSGDADGKTIIK